MRGFRILIVEDEILIADMIKRYLLKEGHHVVGIAISFEEAKVLYILEKPDLALLDIRLNGPKTGIDFAHFIQKQVKPCPFIYLSSQIDRLSIDNAKDTFPSGYLIKPLQKDSLYATIAIAMHNHSNLSQNEKSITINVNDGTTKHLIEIDNILYLQAEHIYVKVYLTNGKQILQRSSLKDFMEQLPEDQFIQSHRSFGFNRKEVSHWDSQNIYINGQSIPISRSRKKIVFDLLQKD